MLFDEQIQAWNNGRVDRELWEANKGKFKISEIDGGNFKIINLAQQETIDRVLDFYGAINAQWLSDLPHMEDPWKNTFAQGQNTENHTSSNVRVLLDP